MTNMNQLVVTAAVASIVWCVPTAQAGLFDSVSKGLNDVAKGVETLSGGGAQSTKLPTAKTDAASGNEVGQRGLPCAEKQCDNRRDVCHRTDVDNGGPAPAAARSHGAVPAADARSVDEALMKEIDQFLNGEYAGEVASIFPNQKKGNVLWLINSYVVDKDRTLGVIGLCRSGTPEAGFRDDSGAVDGIGIVLQQRCGDANRAKALTQAWIAHAKTWLALRKAAAPMNAFLNGEFKSRLQALEWEIKELKADYAAQYLGEDPNPALNKYVRELNRKFDPEMSVFVNDAPTYELPPDVYVGTVESREGLWIKPTVGDPELIQKAVVSWQKKFDEYMKPLEGQMAAAKNAVTADERNFMNFVKEVGRMASGDTNGFVGVEIYKGVRLGMTEAEFHKIEPSPCSDAQFCGKNLNYPSIKKNTISPSGGSIPVIDVYLGGLDLNKSPDETRMNSIVTRVEFVIKNAAKMPGIAAVEKQFFDRFGGDAKLEKTIRRMPRGVKAEAENDPKVQAASAKFAKLKRKAQEYMTTNTTPPEKFLKELKAADDAATAAIAPYAIVEEYPEIRISGCGQVVTLTQPDLTKDVQVTAVFETAEKQLSSLKLSLEEKERTKQAEQQKKAALDF